MAEQPDEPMNEQQALEALSATRAKLAEAAHWSWSFHLAYAGLATATVAATALPGTLAPVGQSLCVVGIVLLAAAGRDKRGVWVNGWRRGPTLWVAIAATVAYLGGALGGLWLVDQGVAWGPLALGALMFPIALFASKTWERVYRKAILAGKA